MIRRFDGLLPDERGIAVRTVLVCVRTAAAAQAIASCAERLGVAAAVRTAVSVTEALARLAEQPADLVLADSVLTRPDPVAFTRRVLARAPDATLVLFGAEEPRVAAATVQAGARGVIRGVNQDLLTVVTKALLLCLPGRDSAAEREAVLGRDAPRRDVPPQGPTNSGAVGAPHPANGPVSGAGASLAPTAAQMRANAGPRSLGGRPLGGQAAPGAPLVPLQREGAPNQGVVRRRLALTERE